jgi:hypothetical protein
MSLRPTLLAVRLMLLRNFEKNAMISAVGMVLRGREVWTTASSVVVLRRR